MAVHDAISSKRRTLEGQLHLDDFDDMDGYENMDGESSSSIEKSSSEESHEDRLTELADAFGDLTK